jgi:hypothetical protein
LHIPSVDNIDTQTLCLLVDRGRVSASDVGWIVGRSPAPTKHRIDRRARPRQARQRDRDVTKLGFPGRTEVADLDAPVANLPKLVEAFTVAAVQTRLSASQSRISTMSSA